MAMPTLLTFCAQTRPLWDRPICWTGKHLESTLVAMTSLTLCATFWTPEQRHQDQREEQVLRRYYQALHAHGVTHYGWQDLLADYQHGLIYGCSCRYRMPLTAQHTTTGGPKCSAWWLRFEIANVQSASAWSDPRGESGPLECLFLAHPRAKPWNSPVRWDVGHRRAPNCSSRVMTETIFIAIIECT